MCEVILPAVFLIVPKWENDDVVRSVKNSSNRVIVTKSVYVHEAPFEEPRIRIPKVLQVPKPRIRFNIIFVKTPETPVQKYSIIPQPQHQEKTLVYVLHRKLEDNRMMNEEKQPKMFTSNYKRIKPEVFFINYHSKNNKTMMGLETIPTIISDQQKNAKEIVDGGEQYSVSMNVQPTKDDTELSSDFLNDTTTNTLIETKSEEQTTLAAD